MLSDADWIALWEAGRGEDPVRRALRLLGAVRPHESADALARWPIGARDGALLDLHAAHGEVVDRVVDCPACGEPVQFGCRPADLRVADPVGGDDVVVQDAWRIAFRLPDSLDLEAIGVSPDVPTARRRLLARCVTAATHDGAETAADALPESVVGAVAARMAERDPQADVVLSLTCLACESAFEHPFDVVPVVWEVVERRARTALDDVHTLAAAYHWSEADILAMGAARRQAYLDRVRR